LDSRLNYALAAARTEAFRLDAAAHAHPRRRRSRRVPLVLHLTRALHR